MCIHIPRASQLIQKSEFRVDRWGNAKGITPDRRGARTVCVMTLMNWAYNELRINHLLCPVGNSEASPLVAVGPCDIIFNGVLCWWLQIFLTLCS